MTPSALFTDGLEVLNANSSMNLFSFIFHCFCSLISRSSIVIPWHFKFCAVLPLVFHSTEALWHIRKSMSTTFRQILTLPLKSVCSRPFFAVWSFLMGWHRSCYLYSYCQIVLECWPWVKHCKIPRMIWHWRSIVQIGNQYICINWEDKL